MHNQEFIYWLQGYFEINIEPVILSKHQIQIIKNHLNLTKATDGLKDNFCSWLDAILGEVISGKRPLDLTLSNEIRKRLNSKFFHEIDNTYKGDKQEMLRIHNGVQDELSWPIYKIILVAILIIAIQRS